MSSSKSKVNPSETKPKTDGKKSIFTHLKAMCENSGSRFGIIALLIVGVACLIAAPFAVAFKGSSAMLYMLANNGKLSGRADGNVYMKNGRIRGMKVPALVQNAYTQAVRAALGSFASSFRALTQAQINAWNAATGFFSVDRFGRSFPLTGKSLYQSLNQNLFAISAAPITDVPTAGAVPGITSLDATIDDSANTGTFTYSPSPTDANVTHIVFATAQLSAGISKPSQSAYRQIATITAGSASPFDFYARYVTKFGAPTTGNKVFLKVVPINLTTGQAGPAAVTSTVVVA